MKVFYRILLIPHNIVMNMNNVMWGTYLYVIVYIQRHNWDNKSDANGKGGGYVYKCHMLWETLLWHGAITKYGVEG